MQIGISINNMGPLSTKEVITRQALKAEQSGLDHIWVLDHIAIPPDQSEGSGGRYVDPLATLAFLSGITSTIKLGTSVLVLPYRPALATAKWVASIQELSSGRLILGVGVGWMEAEFIVTDASLKTRGSVTNETIEFFMECFANDIVSYKDQQFIFSPRPKRPPILIGGNQNAAIQRVMNYGDGWMPMIKDHDSLISECQDLQRLRREDDCLNPGINHGEVNLLAKNDKKKHIKDTTLMTYFQPMRLVWRLQTELVKKALRNL